MQIMSSSYASKMRKPGTHTPEEPVAIKFSVTSETWRFIAYLGFWFFCSFAIVMSNIFVVPFLAKGPADGSSCGPFNRDAPEFGVYLGQGFDFKTQTHLQENFGFSNICTNWDYSPARELTAMVYPVFEYPLIVYLCFDFLATALAYKRGELTEWFWKLSKITFPVCVILCSQFRMIFVCIAYENVKQHTTGFLGLQIALILVALQNSLFIWDAEIIYQQLGSDIKNTRRAILAYIIGDLIISSFKVTATIYVVLNGVGAPWTLARPAILQGKCVGQIVDLIWMVFNAIIPLFISHFRAKNEVPIEITITQPAIYVDEAMGENAPLVANNGQASTTYDQVL